MAAHVNLRRMVVAASDDSAGSGSTVRTASSCPLCGFTLVVASLSVSDAWPL